MSREPETTDVKRRTVGISLDLWYFPEWDQWRLSCHRNAYGEPILAIGPLRLKWKPVHIWREVATND